MYSALPATVAALFFAYGAYVVAVKGITRVTVSFFLLCLTTFFWQAAWAVLFQVHDPAQADLLVRLGYLLILFLPTTLYQFLVEICDRASERKWVYLSYGIAAILGLFDLFSNWFVSGFYTYFFGYYPKAGPLHPIHVLQTSVVVCRGLYITWREQQAASEEKRVRLRLCVASLLIYFFAAVDYLVNYGVGFYPPGVVFVAISLGLIAVAVTRYNLMSPMTVAATVAHEMRTPLASIRAYADALALSLPEVQRGYDLAVAHGLIQPSADAPHAGKLDRLSRSISENIERSTVMIDMMLASSRMDFLDDQAFETCSMAECVREGLAGYPFTERERARVHAEIEHDFAFRGSRTLMVFVMFNLLKNALYALRAANKGEITISTRPDADGRHELCVKDTGSGIAPDALPRVFETYFTTKESGGTGLGLAFCQRAVHAFGGSITCESVLGEYTAFKLLFPPLASLPSREDPAGAERPA